MKNRIIAMMAALFVAAGSMGFGFTSTAAEYAVSEEENSAYEVFEDESTQSESIEEDFSEETDDAIDETCEDETNCENTNETDDNNTNEEEPSAEAEITVEESEEAAEDSSLEEITLDDDTILTEDNVPEEEEITFDSGDKVTVEAGASGYYYRLEDGTGARAFVENGFYYSDQSCKNKLKKVWLYSSKSCDDNNRAYYIGKNGKSVKGFKSVDGQKYLFDKETGRLSTGSGTYKSGGKLYYLNRGMVVTDVGFYTSVKSSSPFGESYYYIMNRSGVLATGYKVITTKEYPGGKKYHFDEKGHLSMVSFTVKGKTFITNQYDYDDMDDWGPEDFYVLSYAEIKELQKVSNGGIDPDVEFNPDGSLYTGWKMRDGKRYYYYKGDPVEAGRWPARDYKEGDNYFVKIGEELYYMNSDGSVRPGWCRIEPGTTVLTFEGGITMYYQEYYFYYDPKTGKLAKGFAKAPVPKLDSSGNIALDANGDVVTTDEEDKLLFAPKYVGRFMPGALVRNSSVNLSGKKYVLDGVGRVFKGGPVAEDAGYRYKKANGRYATGRQDGSYYDPATGLRLDNVIRKSGNKWYYYGSEGKESTDLTWLPTDNGHRAYVVFNKDNSIKCFTDEDGNIMSDRAVVIGGSHYYFLGKKGLPQTGTVKFTLNGGDTPVSIYVGNDGKCDYRPGNGTPGVSMVKLGKKIYVLRGGMVVTDDSKPYAVEDYSNLPAADKKAMDRYYYYYNQQTKGLTVPVYVNADGSVSARTITEDGKTLYINKYGICLNDFSLIRKSGKNWYYNNGAYAGSTEVSVTVTDLKTLKDTTKTAVLTWDDNMKLGKILDAGTGKGITGMCTISDSAEIGYIYYFSNGVPVTGTKTARIAGHSLNLSFDAETGLLDMAALYQQMLKIQ